MDKLGIAGSSLVPMSGKKSTDKKKIEKKSASRIQFKSALKEADEAALQESASLREGLSGHEQAEELLDEVYQLGEELKRDSTLATLKKYRKAVKRFYQHVVSKSLEAEQVEGRLNPRTMSRKQYTLIAVVDEKLEKLGAAVLRSQTEQLEILKKIDEIHGLLIDLTR